MTGQDTGATGADTTTARRTTLPGIPVPALIALYALLAVTPLALSLAQGLPARSFWRELSSGLVMVGFAMMLAQFLLSGRFRRLSGKVGIDLTMRFHQLAAWSVLVFVVVHPFLYTVPRLPDGPGDTLAMLSGMFSSQGLRSGVVAWWLLILLVPLAALRDRLPVRYEIWRLSHGLGAAGIAILSLHHTLRVGTYSGDIWLAAFWIGLTALALASLAYVYVIKPLLQYGAPYRVVSNRKAAERTWEIQIEPKSGPAIGFAPGQFVWLNLGHSPFSLTEHPFSLSSAPFQRPRLSFTIKESGDFTNRIGEIREGTTAYIDGPHGTFTFVGRAPEALVFIAGGVGIAPILGMLRQLRAEGHPHPLWLIYGNRAESQILHREELEAMRSELALEIDYVLSEPPDGWAGRVGLLSPDVLRACLADAPRDALYLVCGPTPMLTTVEATLLDLGVPPGRIVSERFKYD